MLETQDITNMSDLPDDAGRIHADARACFVSFDSTIDQIGAVFEELDAAVIERIAEIHKKVTEIEKRSIRLIRRKARELTKSHSLYESGISPVKHLCRVIARVPRKNEFSTNQANLRLIENILQYTIPNVFSIPKLSLREVSLIDIQRNDDLQHRWYHQAPEPVRRNPTTITEKNCEVIGYGSGLMAFNQPTGVAYNPIINKICVAEYGNHRIQVFDLELKQSSCFGRKGFGVGRFTNPFSISISPSGLIAICDSSYYIQLFTDFFGHGRLFGEEGSGPGRFSMGSSKYVAFDGEENIYVTDSKNATVQKFTMDGVYVRFIYKKRLTEAPALVPVGVAVNDFEEILVLLQPVNQVRVYTTAGVYLRTHELRDVNSPSGICKGPCGGFIVSDEEGRMVRMYSREGAHLHSIVSHSPRGVCFSPSDDMYIVDYYGARITRY